MDPKVYEMILAAASRDGMSISAWMTSAARDALRREAGLAAVAEWEREHGAFSEGEMKEARRRVRAQMRRPKRAA